MKIRTTLVLALVASSLSMPALAQKKPRGGTTAPSEVLQPWMSPEVSDAWKSGHKGQGVTIMVVDDFKSRQFISGSLATGVTERLRHGEWTRKEANMIAPAATMQSQDFNSGATVPLNSGLNVLNLSYGMMASGIYSSLGWSPQETSIINYARNGTAVISKAAGNDSTSTVKVAVGSPNTSGQLDFLNRDLIGAQSAIFVGALSSNGKTTAPASMAGYSNVAGPNTTVQAQFLVVGVEGSKTNLYGTSFAAPIVSGYAAIVGSKFTAATATQIVNQLLATARTDTIAGYNAATHGKGEASITRALAPVSIQ
jgi:subtilisin family serine protease